MRRTCRQWVQIALVVCACGSALSQDWQFRTLAGTTSGGGYADGVGPAARFSASSGVATCSDAIYVADFGNHAIRRVTAAGEVTTWAGALGVAGSADGERAAARFDRPAGIAADAQCNLYVADKGNHTIRRISRSGQVTTLAGAAEQRGEINGRGSAARFYAPEDVAVDSNGVVFVSDTGNHLIRRIAADGQVSTLAGVSGFPGFGDGPGATAKFDTPLGITVDSSGRVLVSDSQNRRIRQIAVDRQVSTLNATQFWTSDVVVGCDQSLYSTDRFDRRVVRIGSDGSVSTIAGLTGQGGYADGGGSAARFDLPRSIAVDTDCSLIVADESDGIIRRVTTAGVASTVAGSAPQRGHVDAKGTDARFLSTADVDVGSDGTVYVAGGGTVRRIASDGTTSTLAGSPNELTHRDGPADVARFTAVGKLAVDPTGGLVVVDGTVIRRVSLSGQVTTIAGAPGQTGYVDGPGAAARFQTPMEIAVANDGTIFISDTINKAIRKISGGAVSTLHRDTALGVPRGIDVDDLGNVYFWDENLASAFKVTADGQRTTLFRDDAFLFAIDGLAVGPEGAIYVGGFRIHSIRRITSDGRMEVFAGADFGRGNQNGTALDTRFRSPGHFAFTGDGRVLVADGNSAIRIGSRSAPPTIVRFSADPKPDGSATLTWESSGGSSARIEPGIGAVPLSGSISVHPTAFTRYRLTVSGDGGEASAETTVGEAPRRRPAKPQ